MKHKLQKVKFRSIDEFLEFLPKEELQLVQLFRNLIFDNTPGVKEKLSYNVPFYSKNKGLFFIWPSSVLWGAKPTYKGVRFGFQQGYKLSDELNYLSKENRKQVFWRDFVKVTDKDFAILKAYIFEAQIVDRSF